MAATDTRHSARAPYSSGVTDEWTPEQRLRAAREREHVVSAIARGLSEWRDVLELIAASKSPDEAQHAVMNAFDFTRVQAMAVMDVQFRRITQSDRDRVAAELVQVRREIEELEGG